MRFAEPLDSGHAFPPHKAEPSPHPASPFRPAPTGRIQQALLRPFSPISPFMIKPAKLKKDAQAYTFSTPLACSLQPPFIFILPPDPICFNHHSSYISSMRMVLLGIALSGFLFSGLPVPVQAGPVKSCCCGETSTPCHSPIVPAPCSSCHSVAPSMPTVPVSAFSLPVPACHSLHHRLVEFFAGSRSERPLLTPPRAQS